MRDAGDMEIGGFGISRKDDLLLVEGFATIKQTASVVNVAFDDDADAESFDRQVDLNHSPKQFARLWIHSHPGDCPLPSPTDEATFRRVFCASDWAAMVIVARGGQTFCRLQFNSGPGGSIEIRVSIKHSIPIEGRDLEAWREEYKSNTHVERIVSRKSFDNDFESAPLCNNVMAGDEDELAATQAIRCKYFNWKLRLRSGVCEDGQKVRRDVQKVHAVCTQP